MKHLESMDLYLMKAKLAKIWKWKNPIKAVLTSGFLLSCGRINQGQVLAGVCNMIAGGLRTCVL
jgi:hypothetical protein